VVTTGQPYESTLGWSGAPVSLAPSPCTPWARATARGRCYCVGTTRTRTTRPSAMCMARTTPLSRRPARRRESPAPRRGPSGSDRAHAAGRASGSGAGSTATTVGSFAVGAVALAAVEALPAGIVALLEGGAAAFVPQARRAAARGSHRMAFETAVAPTGSAPWGDLAARLGLNRASSACGGARARTRR
jgi:hypothetical protein